MKTFFVNAVILVIVACFIAAIVLYLAKAKKRGENCFGCPCEKQCGGKCNASYYDEKSK